VLLCFMIFGHTRALGRPQPGPRAPRTLSRTQSHTPTGRPKPLALEIPALYFQGVAHCPSSLTSKIALCFDTLAHCSVRKPPVLIIMHHALGVFSRIMFQTQRPPALHAAAHSAPRAVSTALTGFTPCLAGGYTDPLCAGPGPGFMHKPGKIEVPAAKSPVRGAWQRY